MNITFPCVNERNKAFLTKQNGPTKYPGANVLEESPVKVFLLNTLIEKQ